MSTNEAPASSGAAPSSAAAGAAPERFDELLARLRGLVDKLESGNLALEDGLRYFEEGMVLCRKGAEILDRAEKRVETLLAGPEGQIRTAPLAAGDDPAGAP
jgi:exodeoxyribonuclease VII small subunit